MIDKQQSSRDFLSDLPLSLIHVILSLIPIRDAVRTSILARQWRYKWNSLPQLAFDEKCVSSRMNNEMDVNRMIHFISQALLLHKGPVYKFELHMPPMEEYQYIDQWLLFLSRNDIRILILEFHIDGFWFPVHSSLYSCQYLTHLELHFYGIPPPPQNFKGFLCLRSLCLHTIQVSSSTIESIVAQSPLLEELTLDGYQHRGLTIRAPNLKYLHLNSVGSHLTLCTPLLEELNGDLTETERFSIDGSSVFRHLRIIKLSHVPFDDIKVTPTVIRLITGAPNLHKLEISGCFSWEDDASEFATESFWDAECAPNFTYESLKVIKMKDFGGEVDEMKLIKFLLGRSPVLEKMIYKPHPYLPGQELLNLIAELLSYRRASASAEILIGKKRKRSS